MTKLYGSEKNNVELKVNISKSFLKTVSAYSNYTNREIVFGISDKGLVVGVDNSSETRLQIENMINDKILPQPNYDILLKTIDNEEIVVLNVKKGNRTPYLYNGKAYRRSDTSTVEVDLAEYKRLILEGDNINFEELKSTDQELSFDVLSGELKEKLNIQNINTDVLRTLGLFNGDNFFNMAAVLLADRNSLKSSGVDIAKFGENINQIEYREVITNCSIISQFYKTISVFEQYYKYERIEGFTREEIYRVPSEAFREALANAIVHRSWDINSFIKISIFNDRVEIISPGSLPRGISKEEYLHRNLSTLRNPIIANVFFRLKIIEMFGTGIARIKASYASEIMNPLFSFSDNSIRIELPVMDINPMELSDVEEKVYMLIKKNRLMSRSDIDSATGFEKAKTIRALNLLIEKNIVEKDGAGPNTVYYITGSRIMSEQV